MNRATLLILMHLLQEALSQISLNSDHLYNGVLNAGNPSLKSTVHRQYVPGNMRFYHKVIKGGHITIAVMIYYYNKCNSTGMKLITCL